MTIFKHESTIEGSFREGFVEKEHAFVLRTLEDVSSRLGGRILSVSKRDSTPKRACVFEIEVPDGVDKAAYGAAMQAAFG